MRQTLPVGALLLALTNLCQPVAFAGNSDALSEVDSTLSHSSSSHVDAALIKKLESVLQADPKNAQAHYLLGRAYEHMGFTDLSVQEYATADKLSPNGPNEILAEFAAKVTGGDMRGALQYYNYVRQRFRDTPILLLMEAQLCELRGQHNEVDYYLKRALATPGRELGLASAAGELRLVQKRPQEALQLAQEDLDKKPDHFRANAVAALACMQMHRPDEGSRFIRKALSIKITDRNINLSFASALQRAGMNGEALEPALIYMAQCTDAASMEAAKTRVVELIRQLDKQRTRNIVGMAAQAVSNTPWDARLHMALGDVYDRLGWLADAEAQYEKGLELDGSVARAYYRLALDEQQSRRYEYALRLFAHAYHADPQNKQIELATYRLMERLANRRNDLAWRLKDSLWKGTR